QRPGGQLVAAAARGQPRDDGAVRVHAVDLVGAGAVADEEDAVAGPGRVVVVAGGDREVRRAAAVRVHQPDVVVGGAIADEGDLQRVGTPRRMGVAGRVVGDAGRAAAVGVH